MTKKRIVVVGGGAGGLGLVTRLGRTLGRQGKADVVLVDRSRTHLWKPLLHEVAAGSLDPGVDALAYRAHARANGYRFQLGAMCGLDRAQKQLQIAALHDDEGEQILPARSLEYDILVLAIGSDANDFGTPGVREHCIFLDQPQQAERFHTRLLNLALRVSTRQASQQQLNVAIVGGGATGVELSAELYNAVQQMQAYGVEHIDHSHLNITLLEAGERILPALPARRSTSWSSSVSPCGPAPG